MINSLDSLVQFNEFFVHGIHWDSSGFSRLKAATKFLFFHGVTSAGTGKHCRINCWELRERYVFQSWKCWPNRKRNSSIIWLLWLSRRGKGIPIVIVIVLSDYGSALVGNNNISTLACLLVIFWRIDSITNWKCGDERKCQIFYAWRSW